MPNLITIRGGVVRCVYDDKFMPLLEALGLPVITRASNVEFDPRRQEWVAVLPSGEEIAHGKNRNDVIQAEIRYLEEKL